MALDLLLSPGVVAAVAGAVAGTMIVRLDSWLARSYRRRPMAAAR